MRIKLVNLGEVFCVSRCKSVINLIMSWRRNNRNENLSDNAIELPDSGGGLYENVPKRDKPITTRDKGRSGSGSGTDDDKTTNRYLSGGVDRSVRARSEKRELVDSWFSKSFHAAVNVNGEPNKEQERPKLRSGRDQGQGRNSAQRPNGLVIATSDHPQKVSLSNGGDNWGQVYCNTRSTEIKSSTSKPLLGKENGVASPENTGTGIRRSRPLPYRGSKTTSNLDSSTNGHEWDFLTSLNEMLRQENFIGDRYNGNNTSSSKPVPPAKPIQDNYIPPQSIPGGIVAPLLSPRPPRPLRRSERRREYAKARSMDAAQFQQTTNLLQLVNEEALTPVNSRPSTPTPGARCPSPYQNLGQSQVSNTCYKIRELSPAQNQTTSQPMNLPYSPQPNHNHVYNNAQPLNCNNLQYPSSKYDNPRRTPPPLPPKPVSMMNNTMSTSLDSIYDRLKMDHGEYNNVFYHGIGPTSRHQTSYPYQHPCPGYNNPVYYYGPGEGGFKPMAFSPYYDHSSSLPRVWPVPGEFRSRSFGSLKVIVKKLELLHDAPVSFS